MQLLKDLQEQEQNEDRTIGLYDNVIYDFKNFNIKIVMKNKEIKEINDKH